MLVPLGASGVVLANVATTDPAPDAVINAVADSYVDHDHPTVNFGQSRQLMVGGGSWSMSYIRFQLPAEPAGLALTAHLVLTYADRSSASDFSAGLAGSWWSENGVDAANGPTPGFAVGRASGAAHSSTVSIDVSHAIHGGGAVTLAVWGSGPASAFDSRESGSAPVLQLWSNGQVGTVDTTASPFVGTSVSPGPTGSASPAGAPSPSGTPSPSGSPTPSGSPAPSGSPSPSGSPAPPSGSPAPGGSPPPSQSPCPVSATLVPSCGAWWGVAANPLDDESWDQALSNFENQIGRSVDIAHYYHKAPELFPPAGEIARAHQKDHERILYLNWKPEMGRSWAQVAAGDPQVDAYIDKEAAYLKQKFTDKFSTWRFTTSLS